MIIIIIMMMMIIYVRRGVSETGYLL